MLFFLTSIFVSSQSLQVNSLRRQQPITIDPQQYENSRSRASFPTWYFVRFHDDDIKNLRNNLENAKIELKSTRMINKHWFSLYLTPSQVNYLSEISDLRQVSTDEKIINPQSLEDAHYLSIEVSHDFIPPSHIKMLLQAENIYRIDYDLSFDFSVLKDRKKDDKDFYKRVGFDETRLTKIANELAQMPQVFSITAHQNPDETNNRAAGYTQKNSRAVTLEGKNKDILHIDRYLQNKGLDGTGTVILVDDTFLDVNSTYFYDPKYPNFQMNTFYKDHRKVVYLYDFLESGSDMSVAEHGTHVSGTVAGEAHNDSDWKHYNGIAPKTKLAFYQAKKNGVYLATNISDIARETNATACTNSWGYRYFSAEIDNTWDITALNHSECLYIFAAGNAGDSYYPNLDYYMTINTPGSAKNIFTIGALDSIPIDEPPNSDPLKHVYAYNYANSDTYELLLKEWSIGDSNTNPGLKAIFENAQYNFYMANESENLKEGMMMVVYSKEVFMALNRTNPPLAVLTSENFEIDNFSALGFTQPFPVFYLEYELVKALYEAYKLEPQVRLIANYMKYTGKEPKRAPFSSKGPSNLGIMKPDIVTPGVTVFSARSDPNGGGGHGGTTIMQGTSMASPNAAGSAALVGQYYQDGKYKNMKFRPSGMLVRATLINAADPVDTIYPNAQTGFGKLNLGNYIMSEGGDDDKIFIGDRLKVGDNQHIFSEIEVTSNDRDLRVTLSYLDAVTNPDSQIALLIDLDLVVIAPDGKTAYRGNQRVDGSEEQYSTNERVLIPKENVTVGKYEIHIFSHVPEIVEDRTAEFSIVVFGSLKTTEKTISFQNATKCIPVVEKHGVCDKETTRNVCNRNFDDTYEGHSCQSYVISYDPELGRHPISIPPFGIQYINMLCPIDGEFEEITYRIVPATYFNPKFATIFNYTQDTDFKVRESSADSVEADIELVQRIVNEGQIEPWTDQSCLYTMVYNKSPYETKLAITSEIIREPTPTRGPRPTETPLPKVQTGFSEVAFYGVLTAAVIFFAATVTLLVLLVVKIKKQSNYHDVDSTSVKVTNQSFLA